jgi:hypothetical protein
MISTAPITVVLVIAFFLGVKSSADLVKHRRRKVKLGWGDIRPRGGAQTPSPRQETMEVNFRHFLYRHPDLTLLLLQKAASRVLY